ncbi:MAG: hypothetical protein COA67_09690 [Lutibacter sp.]|nr:MAG: hypothetical protein COA67_09690 [Lutibacter sp.]
MIQQVNIKGMTCGGCTQMVKNAFSKIEGITDVLVTLVPPQVVLQSENTVSKEQLQSVLSRAGNYEIEEEASSKNVSGGGNCCG